MLHRDIITLSKIIDEINVAMTMMGKADFESFDADEDIKDFSLSYPASVPT